MQRRLVKCLEDLTVSYDSSVRTSTGEIVQYQFGEDGLDPCVMEAKDGSVVDYAHILAHIRNTTPFDEAPTTSRKSLSPTKSRAYAVAATAAAAAAKVSYPDATQMSEAEMSEYIEEAIRRAKMRDLHDKMSNELATYLREHQAKTRKYLERACDEHEDAAYVI